MAVSKADSYDNIVRYMYAEEEINNKYEELLRAIFIYMNSDELEEFAEYIKTEQGWEEVEEKEDEDEYNIEDIEENED
jgi:hypothetical protein